VIAYDGDFLLTMPAFYLMIGYVLLGQRIKGLSLTSRLLGVAGTWPFSKSASFRIFGEHKSIAANLAIRLLQVHFAIVMVTSGLHKLQIGDWWEGVPFWFPLHPPFETSEQELLRHASDASYFTILSAAAYATLAWQLAFPYFAWRPRWRPILLGGAAIAWLGNAFLYRLPLFGPGIFLCSLAYLTSEEWRRLTGWLGYLPGLGWLKQSETITAESSPSGQKTRVAVS
jgi:hypothetical protein